MDMRIAQDLPLTGIDVYSLPPEEGEAVLRRQLAAAYRLVDHFGWTELIYGHLTARVPGDKPHFLINPFGLNYDEVTASNLVKIDVDQAAIADDVLSVLMGDDVDARRNWIQRNAKDARFLDV